MGSSTNFPGAILTRQEKTVTGCYYGTANPARDFPLLATIPGFISAQILKRPADGGVEFLIVTHWASLHAIQRFAGDDAERAVVPETFQSMMIDYDRTVRHYEVIE